MYNVVQTLKIIYNFDAYWRCTCLPYARLHTTHTHTHTQIHAHGVAVHSLSPALMRHIAKIEINCCEWMFWRLFSLESNRVETRWKWFWRKIHVFVKIEKKKINYLQSKITRRIFIAIPTDKWNAKTHRISQTTKSFRCETKTERECKNGWNEGDFSWNFVEMSLKCLANKHQSKAVAAATASAVVTVFFSNCVVLADSNTNTKLLIRYKNRINSNTEA